MRPRGLGARAQRAGHDGAAGPGRQRPVPDRRQRQHQRRRAQARAPRLAAWLRARPRGGHRGRHRPGPPPHAAKGQHRVRPQAAVHRRGGDAGSGDEGGDAVAEKADWSGRRGLRRGFIRRRRRCASRRANQTRGLLAGVRVLRPREPGFGVVDAAGREGSAAEDEGAVLRRDRDGGFRRRFRQRVGDSPGCETPGPRVGSIAPEARGGDRRRGGRGREARVRAVEPARAHLRRA
mmetsp:Transcript_11275/g.48711  ORF Transcript_11275/g.48711 Transcript_11275/m.48711 type:complete len:235 (+) Transcript_11275:446-1150(+)